MEEAQAGVCEGAGSINRSGSIKLGYTVPVQDRTENPGTVVEYVNQYP